MLKKAYYSGRIILLFVMLLVLFTTQAVVGAQSEGQGRPTIGDTVTNANWQVKVLGVSTDKAYETVTPDDPENFHFVIVNMEVTYIGPKDREVYSPESIVLMNITEGSGADLGWSNKMVIYQSDDSTNFTYFQQESIMLSVRKDVPSLFKIAVLFPKRFTEYLLYFPETEGFDINLGTLCTASATKNVNLRSGPGTTFDAAGTLTGGDSATVTGQATGTDNHIWWQLASGSWLRSDLVSSQGDCENLPTVESP